MIDAPVAVEQVVGNEIGDRLKSERTRLGYGQAEFAGKVGVSKTTQFNYESGGRSPDAIYLNAAHRLGVRVGYVITGVQTEEVSDGFVTIPVALPPSLWDEGKVGEAEAAYRVPGMSVSREWLKQRKLNADALVVVTIRGHSMKGVLADGDQVLVDTEDHAPRSGYVYVLRQGAEYAVNYCQMMPGGMLRVSSASPAFPPYDVALNAADDFNILGRVVASVHEW